MDVSTNRHSTFELSQPTNPLISGSLGQDESCSPEPGISHTDPPAFLLVSSRPQLPRGVSRQGSNIEAQPLPANQIYRVSENLLCPEIVSWTTDIATQTTEDAAELCQCRISCQGNCRIGVRYRCGLLTRNRACTERHHVFSVTTKCLLLCYWHRKYADIVELFDGTVSFLRESIEAIDIKRSLAKLRSSEDVNLLCFSRQDLSRLSG